jgi:tetratricopeptide (TPR) repeat protein
MRSKIHILFLSFLIALSCFIQPSFAQTDPKAVKQKRIDSIQVLLGKAKEDTVKVRMLKILCDFLSSSDPEKAIKYINEAYALSAKLNYKKGIYESQYWKAYLMEESDSAEQALFLYEKGLAGAIQSSDTNIIAPALNRLGILYKEKGEFAKALDYYFKDLKISRAQANKKHEAMGYGNISNVYVEQGDYPKALEFGLKVLKLFEEIDYQKGIALAIGNIGNIYTAQHNADRALEYYFKALKLAESDKEKRNISRNLSNIGVVYLQKHDYTTALEYLLKALKINEELESKEGITTCQSNIALVYEMQANLIRDKDPQAANKLYEKALNGYFSSLKMSEELDMPIAIANRLGNIGSLYYTLKKYKEAEVYLSRGLSIATKIGAKGLIKDHYQFFGELYTLKGEHKKAFEYYKKYSQLKDSLFNEEKNEELTRYEMNYEFDKKLAAEKAEQDKRDAVTAAENKKQRLVLFLVSAVLILLFVFAGFVLRTLRITNKQKGLIELKNKETELQKTIIEEKNRGIIDSIHYAKRIQRSLLPTEKYIEKSLNNLNQN